MFKKLVSALLVLLFCSGCTAIKPWERGNLAKEQMAWQTDPLEGTIREHILFSKEGSSGGTSAAGGGCGCN